MSTEGVAVIQRTLPGFAAVSRWWRLPPARSRVCRGCGALAPAARPRPPGRWPAAARPLARGRPAAGSRPPGGAWPVAPCS